MRVVSKNALASSLLHTPPFVVEGAPSVILDTIKRSDDDKFSSSATEPSVILRLYEAYGGHARASIRMCVSRQVKFSFLLTWFQQCEAPKDLQGCDYELAGGRARDD